MPVSTLESQASCRYECSNVVHNDRYDRTRILLDWIGANQRVLEIGCSTGYISRQLVERACSVVGVEIDAAAAELARKYCSSVHVLDLNGDIWLNEVGRDFDAILLADVLEHLVDPARVLQQVRHLLAPSGRVVISLPNVVHWITRAKLMLGRFDYEPTGTLDYTHVRFFTVKTARHLIEKSGYKIIRFHPAIGGWLSGHTRPAWQVLAHALPGWFAFQMLFEARLA